ncbi:MAG: hypothetical protein GZ094_14095 [Mariniphaga sp.]|nr:hypothetical protein [Mariniphaga sp.]
MKNKFAFLSIVLAIALALPMFGQKTEVSKTKTHMKQYDMMSMMGKPTFEATPEGVHFKVWLMTQEEHKKMMSEKKEGAMEGKDMKMDKETKEAMTAGTHHLMLVVTDAVSGKEIPKAIASIMILSPSNTHMIYLSSNYSNKNMTYSPK